MIVSDRFLELAVASTKLTVPNEVRFFGNKHTAIPFCDKRGRKIILEDIVCIGLPEHNIVGRVSFIKGCFGVLFKDKFFPFYEMFIDNDKISAVEVINIAYIKKLHSKLEKEKSYDTSFKYVKIISPSGKIYE